MKIFLISYVLALGVTFIVITQLLKIKVEL